MISTVATAFIHTSNEKYAWGRFRPKSAFLTIRDLEIRLNLAHDIKFCETQIIDVLVDYKSQSEHVWQTCPPLDRASMGIFSFTTSKLVVTLFFLLFVDTPLNRSFQHFYVSLTNISSTAAKLRNHTVQKCKKDATVAVKTLGLVWSSPFAFHKLIVLHFPHFDHQFFFRLCICVGN